MYDAACREVWDDIGIVASTAEASVASFQQRPPHCTVTVTSIPNQPCRSFQCHLNGAQLKPASVQQPCTSVSTSLLSSLPSSVNRQTDQSAALLAQLQQLVESCRLPQQLSSDWINCFSHTLGLLSQQVSRDAVISSSADRGTLEVHTLETSQNNAGVLPAASVAAQLPLTLCSRETYHTSVMASSADQATCQIPMDVHYTTGEMPPQSVTDTVNQQSLLTHLQQLQRMYLESTASTLHSLHVLQQQFVTPLSGATENTTAAVTHCGSSSTAVMCEGAVRGQFSDSIPLSD